MTGIFDSHAHYDDKQFDADRDELLQSLPQKGVCGVINCASDLPTAQTCLQLADRFAYCWAAVGIHPHEAEDAPPDAIGRVAEMTRHPKVVAIGEIGLDYHYDFSPRDVQKELLEKQLVLAKKLRLPVILHDREAHGDMMELLRRHRPVGVMHCFSGSVELMKETVALGLYIGLGGAVTFKNARHPVEVARQVPIDRLLIETDCPYMTPVPHRGRRNDSTELRYVVEKIAAVREMDEQELVDQTRENAVKLFGLKEAL